MRRKPKVTYNFTRKASILPNTTEDKLQRTANAVIYELGLDIFGLSVYNVRPDMGGYDIFYDGELTSDQENTLIDMIAERTEVEKSKIRFCGIHK